MYEVIERHRPAEVVEAQVQRFAGRFRRRLRSWADQHPAFADLLFSFPAIPIALITEFGPLDDRWEAIEGIRSGKSLPEVAALLHLPMWLRRLPPEAFAQPLPDRICQKGDDQAFGRQILNTLPDREVATRWWLASVLAARDAVGDDFAVWFAGRGRFGTRGTIGRGMLPIALYAWFSERPTLPAGRLVKSPWSEKMRLGAAARETRAWLHRVQFDLCIHDPAHASIWTEPARIDGVDIIPLTTSTRMAEEGARLGNCLATYVGAVLDGHTRVYSCLYGAERLAGLEIGLRNGQPVLLRALGPRNTPLKPELDPIPKRWLAAVLATPGAADAFPWRQRLEPAFFDAVWRPYHEDLFVRGIHRSRADAASPAALLAALYGLDGLERFISFAD